MNVPLIPFRNPVHNQFGTFDCEVNHPALGWIPFTVEPGTALEQAIVDAGTAAPYQPPAVPIADVRAHGIDRINAFAGQVRARYITDIPGQEMIYLSKQVEGRAYLALPSPPADLAAFPLIAAEVGVTAPTPTAVVQVWLARAALWTQLAAQIEGARLTTTQLVSTATTPAQVDVHVGTFAAAMQLIP